MKCRFCSDDAVVVVALSRGCVCYPNDRRQALCDHHYRRMTPLGTVDEIMGATKREDGKGETKRVNVGRKRDPHEQHLSTRQKRKRRIEKAKKKQGSTPKKPAGLTPPVDVPDSNNVPAVGQAS